MSKKMNSNIYIGTSGWNHDHWGNAFHPRGVRNPNGFNTMPVNFTTVEVNTTYYRQPRPETLENWRRKTQEGFLWAVKASKHITDIKSLKDTADFLYIRLYGSEKLYASDYMDEELRTWVCKILAWN